jgi:hypothetical protein
LKHGPARDDPSLEPMLAPEVQKHDSCKNGQQALARQNQHKDPGDKEDVPERVPGDHQHTSYHRMVIGPEFFVILPGREIIRRDSNYKKRHKYEGCDEDDD